MDLFFFWKILHSFCIYESTKNCTIKMVEVHVVTGKDTSSITSRDLQLALKAYPHCVIIPGSAGDLKKRIEELGIVMNRQSAYEFKLFDGEDEPIFDDSFNFANVVLDKHFFTRVGKTKGFLNEFEEDVSKEQMIDAIKRALVTNEKKIPVPPNMVSREH